MRAMIFGVSLLLYFQNTFSQTIDANSFVRTDITVGSGNSSPKNVVIGDLDGDGKSDLAVLNATSYKVALLRNTSSSSLSFAAYTEINTPSVPTCVAMGDLDGDGKQDLVVTGSTQTVSVYKNNSTSGSIAFGTKIDFITGSFPYGVTVGDFDGDGKKDLAVANNSGQTVSVLRNTSVGGTISFAPKIDFVAKPSSNWIATDDLDGDGKLDLAVVNGTTYGSDNTVSVFKNTSTIGTISFASKIDYVTDGDPEGVALGDLDGDGKLDIATANYYDGKISIFKNNSTLGAVNFAAKVSFASPNARGVAISDLNGDGKPDLAVSNSPTFGGALNLFQNTTTPGVIGTGSLAPRVSITTGAGPEEVAIGDLNGDGKPEIISANYLASNSTITVLSNQIAFTPSSSPPSIAAFTPQTGTPGTTVTITGTNFSTTPTSNIIKFNGTTAVVTASSATSITTSVPTGATSGSITVAVGTQTATSTTSFTVTSASGNTPVISSFTPTNGTVGTSVTITGTNFSTTAANNSVKFNGTTAVVTSSTTTSITTSVPTGATTGSISVTVGGLTGTGSISFSVGNAALAQPTNLLLSQVASESVEISFTAPVPAPTGYIGFERAGAAPTSVPVDGVVYPKLTSLGLGYVGLIGSDTKFTESGYTVNVRFYFSIYSYTGSGSSIAYSKDSPLTGSILICSIPPAKPTVTISNLNTESPLLTSSASFGNQWYLNGKALSGAINATLTIAQAGIYKVQVSAGECKSPFSSDVPLIVTGDIVQDKKEFELFPNPVTDVLYLQLPWQGTKFIRLIHIDGKTMEHIKTDTNELSVPVFQYATGYYFVQVLHDKEIVTGRFIKK